MSMFVARNIHADHKDLIHDVAFDFHGRRLATCSSDHSVKVWDLDESDEWRCTSSWKTHSGSVWKVTWAHPEFGKVLATCSFDRTAAVWEELTADNSGSERIQSHWVKRTSLVDSRTSVTDIKFAPKHLGLQLATCCSGNDGIVRIYEAPDVMNLGQWSLQHEICCKLSCSCISWSPSRTQPPMIAIGSDDSSQASGGKVLIYEYNENSRRWVKVETIVAITDPVHDISFAPNLGRSFHLLAVATKDVRIISLKPIAEPLSANLQGTFSKFEIRQVGQFDDHNSQVWRVSWNILGTILASSGDDGCVRLWKANYLESWKCIATLKGDVTSMTTEKQPVPKQSSALGNSATTVTPAQAAKYYKLGQVHYPTQLPWH